MINPFNQSLRNSPTSNTNNCENVLNGFDAEAKTVSSTCGVDDVSLPSASADKWCELDDCDDDNELNGKMGTITTTKSEVKINFSVDRLLNKVDVDSERYTSANQLNELWHNGQTSVLTIDQLLSTSSRNGDSQPEQQQQKQHQEQQQLASPKQIVRPMPMRYLQSTTLPSAGKLYVSLIEDE